jgi:DNA polymerase kappa
MICTANYVARRFGVRSAMPGFIGRRLCPDLVFVRPDFTKYAAASEQTRTIFRDVDAAFDAGSLDEAYLDATNYCARHGLSGGPQCCVHSLKLLFSL